MGIQQIVRAIIPDVGDSYGYSPKEILDQDRRILFLQRSPHSKFGRLEWCLPGGKNENPAEPPNIAVFRETGQETGISVYELMNLGPHIIDEDPNGNIKTAFDACDVCGGAKGYAQVGDDVKCIKCGRFFNLEDLGTKNKGGGCWPSHLNHRIEGGYILIDKFELAQGASMFK